MQPQGLAALMPQGQPAPQMNNPRLAAAMDVVTSDAEENILDPRTLAMLKYKDAVQAMQAADQMMAAAQPQPMPPTVAERTRLAAEQGIAGLAARLSPGVQQRGAQIAAQQGAGGLPQIAAPNMARMAGGGIVAFAPGGDVEAAQPKDFTPALPRKNQPTTLAEVLAEAERYDRIKAQAARADELRRANAEDGYGVPVSDGGKNAVGTAYLDSETGTPLPLKDRLSKLLNLISGETRYPPGAQGSSVADPELAALLAQQQARIDGEPTAYTSAPAPTPPTPALTTPPQNNNMPQPAAPSAPQSDVDRILAQLQAPAGSTAPTAAASPQDAEYQALLRKGEQQALESGIASIGRDREAEARAAGARLQELAGVSDLVEQRKAEQASLRALQEAQFSPEEERRRLLRAALAGGAERGLGGFGMGYAAEEGRIAGERQAVQQQSIADLDKLIADLRAMGLSQFQAEQAAAQMVETGRNTGMSTVQSLANARRQADDAAAGREIQREQLSQNRLKMQLEAALQREGYDREDSRLAATNAARIAEAFMESMDVDEGQILRAYMSALEAAQMRGVEDPHSEALASVMSAMEALDLSRPSQVRIVGEAAE